MTPLPRGLRTEETHVHRYADDRVGRTRIVCNARGRTDEVTGFVPDLLLGI